MGFSQKLVFLVLPIAYAHPANGHTSEEDVEHQIQVLTIKICSWKGRNPPVQENWHYIQNRLVEYIQHNEAVSSVIFASVCKQEIFKESKLANRVISSSCSLLSFQSTDSNTNMGSSDHVDIISSIPNCQGSDPFFIFGILGLNIPDQCHNFSLLLWRNSACYNNIL